MQLGKNICVYIYIANPSSSRSHDINIPGLFPRIFTFHASIPLLHVITSYFPTHTFPSPLAISSEIFLDSLKSVHRVNFFLLLLLKKNPSRGRKMEKILNVLVITIIAFKRAFFPVYLASSLLRNLLDISFPSFGSSRGEEKAARISCGGLSRGGDNRRFGLVTFPVASNKSRFERIVSGY